MSHARQICCALLVHFAAASLALAQPPAVSFTSPLAVQPGATTNLALHGAQLADPTGVWTNFASSSQLAADIADNGKNPASVTYQVQTPGDVPLGMAGVRVGANSGVSNLRLLLVDDAPSAADNGQNGSTAQAQTLTLPVGADGKIDAEQSDYYRLHLAAGEMIDVEVFARRLGFALDPVVRFLDASGNELVYADDDPGAGPDCHFAYSAPADADFFLEVRDIRFQGGDAHRYRLRVAHERLAQRDEIVHGEGVSSLPTTLEAEPNDLANAALAVSLPCAFLGALQTTRDRDFFAFNASAGTPWTFRVQTRSLGSAADLLVRIVNVEGSAVADVETAGGGDGELRFTPSADGVYFLSVQELYRRAGEDYRYRIEARPYEPGFTLFAEAEKFDVPRGGVFVTKVTVERRDYNGPIQLSLEGLGENVQLAGNIIGEGQNETTLQATIADSIETGRFMPIRMIGTAKIGERTVQAAARTARVMTAAYQGLAYPPASLDGAIGLGVGPVFPDFFKLTLDREAIRFPRLVGAATVVIKAERLNGFEDAIALSLEGLPPGFSADVKPLEKGQAELAVTLSGPALASDAPYTLRLAGNATFQNQPKHVALAEIPLRIVDPLGAAVDSLGAISPGGSAAIKVRVTRYGDAAPVKLTFANLPPGVTAPAETVLAADQQEVEIPINAVAEAPKGASSVTLVAQTEVKGQVVVVTTNVPLEVAGQ